MSKGSAKREYRKWTTDEVNFLKKYSSKGMSHLKTKFSYRTETAIRVKCSYLNLTIGNTHAVTERLYMVV